MAEDPRSVFPHQRQSFSTPSSFAAGGFHATSKLHCLDYSPALPRAIGILRTDVHDVIEGRPEVRS